jgi:antitoxin HicB
MHYPVRLTPAEDGGFVVTFRDIPEAITQGDDEEEALAMARDALITAMDFYFEDKRTVPAPSAVEAGEHFVELRPSLASKVLLLNEMVSESFSVRASAEDGNHPSRNQPSDRPELHDKN